MYDEQSYTLFRDDMIQVELPSGYSQIHNPYHYVFEWKHLIKGRSETGVCYIEHEISRSLMRIHKIIILKTKMFNDDVITRKLLRRGKTDIKIKAIESLVEAHDNNANITFTRWDVLYKQNSEYMYIQFFVPGDAGANCLIWERSIKSLQLVC